MYIFFRIKKISKNVLRVVWAKWWVLPSWPASCWCRAIGPWWGSRDRRRAIPCHGRPVSAGGSWTVGVGRLQRSYHPLRRWPDLLVLGPWSSFHSSSTFFFWKKKGKAIQQLFQPLFCCCRRYSKGMLLLFLSKGGNKRWMTIKVKAINNLAWRLAC